MGSGYRVKEIFGPTLQGEGLHAGWPCLFVRLAGCNAWDGRPETRAASACPYCDTDFRGGEQLDWHDIAARLAALVTPQRRSDGSLHWPGLGVVLTGGEPLLQADAALLTALSQAFAWVDVETNGTRPAPIRLEHLSYSCSPKGIPGQPVQLDPDWWKILIPAQERFLDMALTSGRPVYVQPVCPDQGPSGPVYQAALQRCIHLCLSSGLRLSLQQHKYIGVP